MDDLDEIYRPVFADAVVEDRWSGATGTPAQLQRRFAARHLLPHSGFGLKAVARRDTGRFNSTNRKRARESPICSLKSIPTVVWAMLAYGFTRLGVGRTTQGVLGSNPSSINLTRRLGFRFEHGLHGNTVGVLER